jgi:acylphosphatase
MRMHNLSRRKSLFIAALIAITPLTAAPTAAQLNIAGQNVIAVSGIVTGNVQGVGFRAMIQKRAIQFNLAGFAQNNSDKSVRFVLQGAKDRIDQALKAIRGGTKNSSNVDVSTSPASLDTNLETFTVVGWTSDSRHISHPYDLVFNLRHDNATVSKDGAKAVWLGICRNAVKGEDAGKCDKDDH